MKSDLEMFKMCRSYLHFFCVDIPERTTGSEGNRKATQYFNQQLKLSGLKTDVHKFTAMDWHDGGASLTINDIFFKVFVSPYSLPCRLNSELVNAGTVTELKKINCTGKILFLHGEITEEQLMPKNFVFYNPAEHKKIISILENKKPQAIICATSRNGSLAGGAYPFPLIEDGDFNIPSVYMTDKEGDKLMHYIGHNVHLESNSKRILGNSFNVIGRMGSIDSKKIAVTAHIDSKKGSPGAIDNATGIVILLLLAKLLVNYSGKYEIELAALNGEDHFAAPGQMNYIALNEKNFNKIILNINIDGAGFHKGPSTISFFNLPEYLKIIGSDIINDYPGIVEGVQWPQGDHSIFIQHGIPAIAISSKWLIDNIENQEITHTDRDRMEIVDCSKIIELAKAIRSIITKI